MPTRNEARRLTGSAVVDHASTWTAEADRSWVEVHLTARGGSALIPLEGAEWDDAALRAVLGRGPGHEAVRQDGIPCVRHPREPLDPALFDGTVSYSVEDAGMVDDDRSEPGFHDESARERPHDLGRAMESAAEERREGVSGHMLAPTPAPLDATPS